MNDHRDLVRDLLARGLEVATNGTGHIRVTDGELVVVIPSTPDGGNRSMLNARAKLRRAGFLPPPSGGTSARGRRPEKPVQPYSGPSAPYGRRLP